ncbi:DinI family protein [Leclercia adecarboxylata]|uniref:DinI family protein n=1 Tax=Leclercia adecarboxylata TaxID=83655 RepID=UPI0021F23825|nr:DinI family protein [Leclercia adecarboxylata]UYM56347.1 DinI family protein [Leclercia adecarboxylata]
MKVELTIDRTKEIPKGAVPALEKELLKRLQNQFDDCSLVIRRAGSDGLSVYGGEKEVKKTVEEIISKVWVKQLQRREKVTSGSSRP